MELIGRGSDGSSRPSLVEAAVEVIQQQWMYAFHSPDEVTKREVIAVTVCLAVTVIVICLYLLLEPYLAIEIWCLSLLLAYLLLHYILLKQTVNQMTILVGNDIIINKKYLLVAVICLITVLIVSMSLPDVYYSDPTWASINFAIIWRICISIVSMIVFSKIDYIFNNYYKFIKNYADHYFPEQQYHPNQQHLHQDQQELQYIPEQRPSLVNDIERGWNRVELDTRLRLLTDNNIKIKSINTLCYCGFTLCCITLVIFYAILYSYEKRNLL